MRCVDDAMEWQDDFERWWMDRCSFEDGRWSPIHGLHNDYNEWALRNYGAPCRMDVFRALLRQEGCSMEGQHVYGLTLAGGRVVVEPPPDEAPLQKGAITAPQLLEDLLSDGPRSTLDIRAASSLAQFSWSTMLIAKAMLNVHSPIAGIWELPEKTLRAGRGRVHSMALVLSPERTRLRVPWPGTQHRRET